MIRALRSLTSRPDLRRIVGLAAVVALLLLVFVGAAHAGEHHETHAKCGVCDAVTSIGTSESFVAPQFVAQLFESHRLAPPTAREVREFEPRRFPAPRGPPAVA